MTNGKKNLNSIVIFLLSVIPYSAAVIYLYIKSEIKPLTYNDTVWRYMLFSSIFLTHITVYLFVYFKIRKIMIKNNLCIIGLVKKIILLIFQATSSIFIYLSKSVILFVMFSFIFYLLLLLGGIHLYFPNFFYDRYLNISIINCTIILFTLYLFLFIYMAMRRISTRRQLFTSHLKACLKLQIPLVEALDFYKGNDSRVGIMMKKTSKLLKKGMSLSEALAGRWACLPPWYIKMLEIGEKKGNLEEIVGNILNNDTLQENERLNILEKFFYPLAVLPPSNATSGLGRVTIVF